MTQNVGVGFVEAWANDKFFLPCLCEVGNPGFSTLRWAGDRPLGLANSLFSLILARARPRLRDRLLGYLPPFRFIRLLAHIGGPVAGLNLVVACLRQLIESHAGNCFSQLFCIVGERLTLVNPAQKVTRVIFTTYYL